MRVEPSIINPIATQIAIGNGLQATAFTNQAISTTILAEDGETIVIGGLISKSNTRNENKIPFFGDLPYLGALFRYRTQSQAKSELVLIITPHIIRCPADNERISVDRLKLLDLNMKDVEKTYGKDYLLNPEMGPPKRSIVPAAQGFGSPRHTDPLIYPVPPDYGMPQQYPPNQTLPQPQPQSTTPQQPQSTVPPGGGVTQSIPQGNGPLVVEPQPAVTPANVPAGLLRQ